MKASELLLQSAEPFDRACMIVMSMESALENLLDVFERSEAGYPVDIELRILARELAKAALRGEET